MIAPGIGATIIFFITVPWGILTSVPLSDRNDVRPPPPVSSNR